MIDGATDSELNAAWMAATNDVNEGVLGSYRVHMRDKPMATLHQFNMMSLYVRNQTQEFMDRMLNDEDMVHIRKLARDMDEAGLEKQWRQKQKEADEQAAEIRRAKVAATLKKEQATFDRLSQVTLIASLSEIQAQSMTVAKLQDQLDALKVVYGVPGIPYTSHMKKKDEKRKALEDEDRER